MLPRHKLPQIPADRLSEFVEFLREHGIVVHTKRVPILHLKAIQSHVNPDKIEALKQNQEALSIPLIVSRTGYILDGHHRWMARKELDPEEMIPVIWCDCAISTLVSLGHEFEYSFTRTVHEQRILLQSLV